MIYDLSVFIGSSKHLRRLIEQRHRVIEQRHN